jgi:arylsulfatase A-like enzyme
VRWPARVQPGSRCGNLVSTVDIAPTILALAGLTSGPSFQGKDISRLLGDARKEVRDLIFAERNWHDYACRGRAVRSEQYKYIRNYDAGLPLTPPAGAVRSPTFQAMRLLRDQAELTPPQLACFARPRLEEELYDVKADPEELHNLAGNPRFDEVLAGLRRALEDWQRETRDVVTGALSTDEFDRETGQPLPNRVRPRANAKAR